METYNGYVRTPADAIKLFEACRLGLLPRVQRRLSEKERQSIRSGSVFVWDEREAGMRRWTDGKSWSASRVSGSFLTYREMEGKRGSGFGNNRRSNGRTPDGGRLSDEDQDGEPEGYRYKADGLMKQSFSITTSQGQHLHLISYFSRSHHGAQDLPQPSTDSQLRHIIPAKGMYPESSLHEPNPPALTRAPMAPYNNTPPEQPAYGYAWGGQPAWVAGGPGWPPSPNEPAHWPPGKPTPDMKPHLHPHALPPHAYGPPHGHPHPPPPHLQVRAPPTPVSRPPSHHHQQLAPQLPLPPASMASAPPPGYGKALSPHLHHERAPPPPHVAVRPPYGSPAHGPDMSPRAHQLQLQAAQAVMIDPRLATSARNPQGPLPAMGPTRGRLTPPRTHSVSPPRHPSAPDHAHGVNKASLKALLLHPTPASSEPGSANPVANNSAGSSPRAMGGSSTAPTSSELSSADNKALGALNRKFRI